MSKRKKVILIQLYWQPLWRFNFKLKIQYQSYYKDKYNQALSGTLGTNSHVITECSKESGCSQVICKIHDTCHVYFLQMWLWQNHACLHLLFALANIERASFIQKLQNTIIYLKHSLVRSIHFLWIYKHCGLFSKFNGINTTNLTQGGPWRLLLLRLWLITILRALSGIKVQFSHSP